MTELDSSVALPALNALRDQLSALAEESPREVRAGHLDLGADLWLSCDPESRTRMHLAPGEGGLRLEVTEADSGRWTCLGLRLQPQELAQARRVGILVSLRSGGMVSYRPSLRYFMPEGGFQDRATAAPVVMVPGPREELSHIPVDAELAARATGCELNLFFLDNDLRVEALSLEPLLML